MAMRSYLSLTIVVPLLITALAVRGQNSLSTPAEEVPVRVEIPVQSANETYRVLSCGHKGLVLFFRSRETTGEGKVNWYFCGYDTNLVQTWVRSVPLLSNFECKFTVNGSDTLALLFTDGGKPGDAGGVFSILRILPSRAIIILNEGAAGKEDAVTGFSADRDRAWLSLDDGNGSARIMTIRLGSGFSRTFPLGVGDRIRPLWMRAEASAHSLVALVSRQISKKVTEYYFVGYDTTGKILRESPLSLPFEGQAITHAACIATGQGNSWLVLGTYGTADGKSSQKGRLPDESTGFFSGVVNAGTPVRLNTFNFLQMKNAASLAGEEELMDLQRKAVKKKKTLAEYSLDISVVLHEPFWYDNQCVLLADGFAPQYHTENYTDFDFYGRPFVNSYSVFDGYRYYKAAVAGFAADGTLVWDNNVELRNLVSVTPRPQITCFPFKDELVLCYQSDGKIGSRIIRGSDVTEQLDFASMDLLYPDDKLVSESGTRLETWYGTTFLSYGYQEIKNIGLDSGNKRLVFYLTKLKFDR